MKIFLFFLTACVGTAAFAQADSTSATTGTPASITPADTARFPASTVMDAAPVTAKAPKNRYPKTVVKMNVSSLLFKNYQFALERSLTRKISAAVWFRTMPTSPLSQLPAFKKVYKATGGDQATLDEDLSQITASNKTWTGEFRFYGGRKPGPRGFYLGLYGRYAAFNAGYRYTYESNTKQYLIPISVSANGIGGGLYTGVQWLIGKRVALDWQIMGGHWGRLTGSGSGAADLSDLSEQEKQGIKTDIEDAAPEVGGKKMVTATVGNSGVGLKLNSPFVGLRSGISIGISF